MNTQEQQLDIFLFNERASFNLIFTIIFGLLLFSCTNKKPTDFSTNKNMDIKLVEILRKKDLSKIVASELGLAESEVLEIINNLTDEYSSYLANNKVLQLGSVGSITKYPGGLRFNDSKLLRHEMHKKVPESYESPIQLFNFAEKMALNSELSEEKIDSIIANFLNTIRIHLANKKHVLLEDFGGIISIPSYQRNDYSKSTTDAKITHHPRPIFKPVKALTALLYTPNKKYESAKRALSSRQTPKTEKALLLEDIENLPKSLGSKVEAAMKSCNVMEFHFKEQVGITESKILGKPYWPRNMDYPKTNSGLSMALLAQINLKDLKVPMGLPENGLLQFFVEEDLYNRQHQAEIKVVYHPTFDETDLVSDFEKEVELYGQFANTHIEIKLKKGYELPSQNGNEFLGSLKDSYDTQEKEIRIEYLGLVSSNLVSKIGNYSHWNHNDSRNPETELDYIPIFQFFDMPIPGLQYNYIQVFIPSKDLEKQNFDNVILFSEPNT